MPRTELALPARARIPAALIAAASLCAPAATRAPDLDVAVPSGSPLEWRSLLPQRYVRDEAPFSLTRSDASGRYATTRPQPAVRAIGVLRPAEILTLDFAGHLGWEPLKIDPNATGGRRGDSPYPPPLDVDLYWQTTASLLQMLLHPQRTSRLEGMARLLVLGEGALAGLDAANSLGEMRREIDGLRDAIGRTPASLPEPLLGATPFATMLQRFVASELVDGRPFANDLRFGRRLFLLRDEIVPHVVPYLESGHSLARRNAVAVLASIDSPTANDALVRIATAAEDAVMRARALVALGDRRMRSAVPALAAALAGEKQPTLKAALIHALGRIGDAEAVPALIAAETDRENWGELTLARLAALTRVPAGARRAEVMAWADEMLRRARGRGGPWLRDDPDPPSLPDSPDPEDLRARTGEQLALLLLARLSPDDAAAVGAALGPVQSGPGAGPGGPFARRFQAKECRSLGEVTPYARSAFVDALPAFGDEGVRILRDVILDGSAEDELRSAALAALPLPERLATAAALALDEGTDLALRLASFETLDLFGDARVLDVAEVLGRGMGLVLRDRDDVLDHWRLLLVTQALGRRNKLGSDELGALLAAVGARAVAPAPRDVVGETIDRFLEWVASTRPAQAALETRARTFVMEVFPGGVSLRGGVAPVGGGMNGILALNVAGLARAVVDSPRSERVRAATARAIRDLVELSAAQAGGTGRSTVDPIGTLPLVETLLMELARKADARAIEILAEVARDTGHPDRATACIALGATKSRAAAPALLYSLRDEDPFVRLCAYLALRSLTSQDFFADWIDGSPKERERAFQEWGAWIVHHSR